KLKWAGYRVIPVNPREKEVLGEKTYASLLDIPDPVDIVDVFRRSEDTPPIADDAVKIGAKALWLQTGISNEDAAARAKAGGSIAPDTYKQLKFRYVGPVGNRIIAVAGVPGSPYIYYAGAASGGIFKTTDNGAHWDPIFDDQDVASVGSLAVAPSDPNVVWAGTGEAFIRSNISIGNGIYK